MYEIFVPGKCFGNLKLLLLKSDIVSHFSINVNKSKFLFRNALSC